MMRRLALCFFALVLGTAFAATPAEVAMESRLKKLDEELRCLVCQNQSLADSNAPLAQDLRREVRSLADAGKSDAEIKDFLVARYGDFVLYKPPVKSITWLLWFGPFVLLAGGALAWWSVTRRRGRRVAPATAAAVDGDAVNAGVERARELLNDPRE
jgi:cytochrome c-type biogenesis protein CcmH